MSRWCDALRLLPVQAQPRSNPRAPRAPTGHTTRTNLCSLLSADFRVCLLLLLFLWPLRTSELPAAASPSHYVQARSRCGPDEAGELDGHMVVETNQAKGPTALPLFLPLLPVLPRFLPFCFQHSSASDETRLPVEPHEPLTMSNASLLS